MARRKAKKKPSPLFNLAPERQREILGLLLLAIAGITVLSLLSANRGTVTETWILLLRRLFGWGFLMIPLSLGGDWLLDGVSQPG